MAATDIACPFCGETIKSTAKKCRHCDEFLEPGLTREAILEKRAADAAAAQTAAPASVAPTPAPAAPQTTAPQAVETPAPASAPVATPAVSQTAPEVAQTAPVTLPSAPAQPLGFIPPSPVEAKPEDATKDTQAAASAAPVATAPVPAPAATTPVAPAAAPATVEAAVAALVAAAQPEVAAGAAPQAVVAAAAAAVASAPAGNTQAAASATLTSLFQLIGQLPDSPEKEKLLENLKALEGKTDEDDESGVEEIIKNVAGLVPDVAEIAINTLINPASGVATLVQKVASRIAGGQKK